MEVILEARELRKTYGSDDNKVNAVSYLSLAIEKGSFVAIVGTSGSGKSTLLHILGGLCKPNHGEVLLGGQSLYEMSESKLTILRRRRMGFVFQFFNLLTNQNVIENIVLPSHLDGKKEDSQYIEEILQTLNLTDKRISFIHELSGGQQQRVAIARALASKPDIIFADEPTGNLDHKSTKEVIDVLQKSQKKFHQTVILVTHDEKIAKIADRIIYLEDGQIIRDEKNENQDTDTIST